MISIVLPDIAVCTSPGFCAFPSGIFSAAQTIPITRTFGFSNAIARIAPRAQAEVLIDAEGRKRRLYKLWRTPLETLLSLDCPQQFLRPGLSVAARKRVAASMSDTEAAQRMQQAKNTMFERIRKSA